MATTKITITLPNGQLEEAQAVGVLLAQTGTSDITDAHVVICAQRAGHAVITSDPLDLRRLDAKLRVITV